MQVAQTVQKLNVVRNALEKVRPKSHDLIVVDYVAATASPLQSGPLTSHSQLLHCDVGLSVQLRVLLRERTRIDHLHLVR